MEACSTAWSTQPSRMPTVGGPSGSLFSLVFCSPNLYLLLVDDLKTCDLLVVIIFPGVCDTGSNLWGGEASSGFPPCTAASPQHLW